MALPSSTSLFRNLPHAVCVYVYVWKQRLRQIFLCDFWRRMEMKRASNDESGEKFCLERKLIGILIIYEKRNFTENGEMENQDVIRRSNQAFAKFVNNWKMLFTSKVGEGWKPKFKVPHESAFECLSNSQVNYCNFAAHVKNVR